MFRMHGRTVQVLRYKIEYADGEEQRTEYAVTEEDANAIAQRTSGVISALVPLDDEWMDGIEVADVPDTYKDAERIKALGKAGYMAEVYIPTLEQSSVVMMRSAFALNSPSMDDDMVIQCSGLAEEWKPGKYEVGAIYNAGGQTWECYQAYDNDVYPDIKPEDPSWYTFNRPLHGKSKETARPFVPVQGGHDIYRSGEYMIYTDGLTYKCLSDTNYSPEEYAQAWEVYDG